MHRAFEKDAVNAHYYLSTSSSDLWLTLSSGHKGTASQDLDSLHLYHQTPPYRPLYSKATSTPNAALFLFFTQTFLCLVFTLLWRFFKPLQLLLTPFQIES